MGTQTPIAVFRSAYGSIEPQALSLALSGPHPTLSQRERGNNIDSIARDGALLTDCYAQASCTAGSAAFITGQLPMRTGLTTVWLPGAPQGLRFEDPILTDLLKPLDYMTAQIGKNHLGDRNEFLPTVHGFDEFDGNLYHLNAEEEPEQPDYPRDHPRSNSFSCHEEYWSARHRRWTIPQRIRDSTMRASRRSATRGR
jgi:arylsulfatase A-like enzyme